MSKNLSVIEQQKKIVAEFGQLLNWEDKYKRIIELGKKLPPFPEEFQTEQLKVKGCQSQVWLKAQLAPTGELILTGDSDALLVKGLLALMLDIFSNNKPQEILEAPMEFLKELGLDSHLSPSRSNGVFAMIKQIRLYAQAFLMMEKSKIKN